MLMFMIITAIAMETTAMATDATKEHQQLRNAACCNYTRSGRAHTSRGHEIRIPRNAIGTRMFCV